MPRQNQVAPQPPVKLTIETSTFGNIVVSDFVNSVTALNSNQTVNKKKKKTVRFSLEPKVNADYLEIYKMVLDALQTQAAQMKNNDMLESLEHIGKIPAYHCNINLKYALRLLKNLATQHCDNTNSQNNSTCLFAFWKRVANQTQDTNKNDLLYQLIAKLDLANINHITVREFKENLLNVNTAKVIRYIF